MECFNFKHFCGEAEASYSQVITQSFVLSQSFREAILKLINDKHKNNEFSIDYTEDVLSVAIENDFYDSGRIDILIELKSGMLLGIENKKWAKLQPDQLNKYKKALEKRNQPYILIFLTPMNYSLNERDKPRDLANGIFIQINYSEINLICDSLIGQCKDPLAQNYFLSMKNFLGGLIMKPLSSEDINSLKYFRNAIKKIVEVLNSVNDYDGKTRKIESDENYILSPRQINNHSCFFGLRIDNNYYYNQPLLNDQPELIFYVKDIEKDEDRARENNDILDNIYQKQSDDLIKNYICTVNYYPRKKPNECRFAIRKELNDFNGKEIDNIVNWFTNIIERMKGYLSDTSG